jgi:hypothetical protein
LYWDTLTALHDATDKDAAPIHIAWWDTFDEPGYSPGDTKRITLTGLTGAAVTATAVDPAAETVQEVTDYATALTTTRFPSPTAQPPSRWAWIRCWCRKRRVCQRST